MSKRRVDEDFDIDVSSTDESDVEADASDQDMEEVINVDFDYFDLNPLVDFHATKTFLRQLFGDDAIHFDISGLADLILTNNAVGTAIKTDGQEGDPFALLSVIDIYAHSAKPSVKAILDYVLEKTKPDTEFNMVLKKLLHPAADLKRQLKVGLIISERMINMPVEVVPPTYKLLFEEMEKAEDAHEKYEFDYFLVISKIYKLVHATISDDYDEQKLKKKKVSTSGAKGDEFDYFHYEDMVLEQNAKYHGHYEYTEKHQETDSRRVFTEYGIDPRLSVLLLSKEGLKKSVPEMEEKFPPF